MKIIIAILLFFSLPASAQIINASAPYRPHTTTGGDGYDEDAQKFIDSAGISGGEAAAINNLVIQLKDSSVWDNLDFIYPFIGSTAATQKWNLKDPATFKLTFNGTWTHSSSGADPAANNSSYANTGYTPSSSGSMTTSSCHVSIYLAEPNSGAGSSNWDIGSYNGETQAILFSTLVSGSVGQFYCFKSSSAFSNSYAQGYFIVNLESSTLSKLYQGDAQVHQNTNASGALPTYPIYLGSINLSGTNYSNSAAGRKISFATAGTTLSSTEIRALTNILIAYNTAIGR